MTKYFKNQKILANCGDYDFPVWVPGQIVEINNDKTYRPYLIRLENESEGYFPPQCMKLDNYFNRRKHGIKIPTHEKEYRCESCGETFIRRRFVKVDLCLKCQVKRKRQGKYIPSEKTIKSRERSEKIYTEYKEGKGKIKQNELARKHNITRQAVSLIIIKMKKKEVEAIKPQVGE